MEKIVKPCNMKNSTLLALLSGLFLVACGEATHSSSALADEPVGTAEAAVCADGSCGCFGPDCDALNWTLCGSGGTTTCFTSSDGVTCRSATCVCSSSTKKWVCP